MVQILILLILLLVLIIVVSSEIQSSQSSSSSNSLQTQTFPPSPDIVIIGAGTAGCVVARRLSQQFPHKTIVLLERGGDHSNNPVVYNPKNGPIAAYQEPFSQVLTTNFPNVNISLASMFGGGSSHNFSLAVKGSPNFYNSEWEKALGLTYLELQPYFTKIDEMMAISQLPVLIDLKSKILPVLSLGLTQLIKSITIFLNLGPLRASDSFSNVVVKSVSRTKTVPIVNNYNESITNCTSKIPQIFVDSTTGIRQNTFNTYLPDNYLKTAKNLTIIPNANVTHVGSNFVTWKQSNSKEVKITQSNKIILAAGAVYTPFLLLKSGLSHVGQDLQNHYGCQMICSIEGVDKFSSGPVSFVNYLPNSRNRDWQLTVSGSVDNRLLEHQHVPPKSNTFTFLLWRLNCRSRGTVTASGSIPTVNLNMFTDGDLSDPNSDMSCILEGLRWTYTVVKEIRKDYPTIKVLYPPESVLIQNDSNVLTRHVLTGVSVTDHYCATCPLGTFVNPTDFSLINNPTISIVDASVFPHISDGNTTYPVLVMAEVAADRILESLK